MRQDLTAQHDAVTTLGVKANRIYVDHGLLARRTRAATLDLTTVLTTTVTTVARPTTPTTVRKRRCRAWSRGLPAPGSLGAGSRGGGGGGVLVERLQAGRRLPFIHRE
jgi:hypothetical protein